MNSKEASEHFALCSAVDKDPWVETFRTTVFNLSYVIFLETSFLFLATASTRLVRSCAHSMKCLFRNTCNIAL